MSFLEKVVGYTGRYTEIVLLPLFLFIIIYNIYLGTIKDTNERKDKKWNFIYGFFILSAFALMVVLVKLPNLVREQNTDLIEAINNTALNVTNSSRNWASYMTKAGYKWLNAFISNFDKTMAQVTKQSGMVRMLYGKVYTPPKRVPLEPDAFPDDTWIHPKTEVTSTLQPPNSPMPL